MRRIFLLLINLGALVLPAHFVGAGELWIYLGTNLQSSGKVEQAEKLFSRAAKAGYTHVLISDSKFARLSSQPPSYRENCLRVRKSARQHGLILVPALFGLGYSNDHLHLDPNLAEGLPVEDALFVVQNGQAQIVADPPVSLPGCGEVERSRWKFVDSTLAANNDTFRASDPTSNARFYQRISVAKFHYYTVSVQVRTQDFSGEPACKVLTPEGKSLSYTNLQVSQTQEWATHRITFNSLDHEVIGIYFGTWGSAKGSVEWKKPEIREEGLLNVLRREGCPLVVKIDGGRVLEEGVDFESVVDQKLARPPGSGDYDVWHEAPPIRTNLPDGTRLRVSFYHPHIFHDGQVCICPSEPKTMEILKAQAKDLHELWQADNYMMLHDEWRSLGWDEACLRRKLTAGELVADNVKACRKILAEVAPQARIHVWSDMFDPHHNAVKDYYLVNGDLSGSWEGLNPSVVIMNWNSGKPEESPAFFDGRGHRQILAGYYDKDPFAITSWLAAARKVPGVIGVMYTTWEHDYSQLEEFSRLVSEAEKTPVSSKAP